MSGTLQKSPSEGDISSTVVDNIVEESSTSKTESIQKPNYQPPDFKKGFLANSGFRLVWKSSNTGDFTNLNKVLDLPQESKLSSISPKVSQSIQIDNVFSEYFDPLAVQKRDSANSEDFKNSEVMVSNTENKITNAERKKAGIDLKILDMPSVRKLKSLFESSAKEEVNVGKQKVIKRSHTLSGHEIGSIKLTESQHENQEERRHSTSTANNMRQDDKSIVTASAEMTHELESIEKSKKDSEVKGSISTISDKMSSVTDIESGHLHKVKDLLLIFQKFERAKSVPSNLNEIANKSISNNRIQGKIKLSDDQIEIGDRSETIKKIIDTEKTSQELIYKRSNKSEEILHKIQMKLQSGDYIEIPSPTSVYNLRQKWEGLMSPITTVEKKDKGKMSNSKSNPTKREIIKQDTGMQREKSKLKLDLSIQTDPEVSVDSSEIERNTKFRNSVKDVALRYESNKVKDIKSAPSTPSGIKNTFSSSPTSPLQLSRDRHQSLATLGNVQRFSSEAFLLTQRASEEMKPSKETNLIRESQKEMSLGSLQRQASVTKIKEKYESQLPRPSSSLNMISTKTENILTHGNYIPSPEILENLETYKRSESQKEISLGSLQRQASVTKMKEKYESKLQRHRSSPSMKSIDVEESLKQEKQDNKSRTSEIFVNEAKRKSLNTEERDKSETSVIAASKIVNGNSVNSVNIHLNNNDVKATSGRNALESSKNQDEKVKKKSKIEELVESFMKSEGVSTHLEVSKEESLLPLNVDKSKTSDENALMKATDTFKYPNLHDEKAAKEISLKGPQKPLTSSETKIEFTEQSSSSSSSSSALKKSVVAHTAITRTGSRELKPDELKYFQSLPPMQDPDSNISQKRERSSSFDSGSATSTLSKEDLTRSKLRSSSRQYRDLHKDELKFFDSKINGTMSKMSFRSSSELLLRQEVLEKTIRSSSFENGERKE